MEDLKPSSAPTLAAANNSDLSNCGRATIQAQFSDFGKRKCDQITSPLKSLNSPSSHDSPMKTVATPATNAMTTATWLQTVICSLPPKPSPELERFLSSCDRDVASGITRRVNIILEAIFTSNNLQCASMMDSTWVEQRKLEALKLYYRVLQTVCMAESQILNVHNLTSLLTHERLHRCMLACSAELVLVTHKTVTMPFPAVIESIGITSFDLSKVIESFIRHEESLPRELRRHLNSLEEQLLESTVWEKGSSMYNSLAVARPDLSSEINRLGLLAKPMPSLDEISMHTDASCWSLPCIPSVQKLETLTGKQGGIPSPKKLRTGNRSILVERSPFNSPLKDRLLACNNVKSKPLSPALPSAVASPTRQNPEGGGEMCAETAINVFFNKVAKLAAVRIKGMVERLKLSQQTRESVYRLFQQILSQRTILFFNRHVDQIILCCFYLVAKISKVKLTFSDIISHYKKQPFCKPRVPHSVFVDWSSAGRPGKSGQEHVGIKTFYNEIFLISVRPLLLELEPDGLVQNPSLNSETKNSSNGHPGSPKLSPFPKLPDMSPRKVSAVHNVYVSPLRATKRDALISNGLKSYYACIGESTHAYRSPSKDLSAINNHLNGNRKARGMLNFDDVGGGFGLVSDFMVANSISLRNGSCASSSPEPTVKSEQVDS